VLVSECQKEVTYEEKLGWAVGLGGMFFSFFTYYMYKNKYIYLYIYI
jgi:hypothetical protein